MICVNSFGKTPACLYLATLLQERNDPVLARKVGRVLASSRELLNDIVACHYHTSELKRSSFGTLIGMLETAAREKCEALPDKFIGSLCLNIIVGELRTHKRRLQTAAHTFKKAARSTPEGESVPVVKAFPRPDEETEEARVERLKEKSSAYLERHNKRNTLY